MTWNATGIMSSSTYLSSALSSYNVDICGVSEHWLRDRDLHFLDCIDNMYISHAVSDLDLCEPSNRKVGKGGVCILWKRTLDKIINPLLIDDDRIVGIQIQVSPDELVHIFQVYLSCSNHRIRSFRDYIDKLENCCLRIAKKKWLF